MKTTELQNIESITALLSETVYFQGLSSTTLREVAAKARIEHYPKKALIFQANDPCRYFFLVSDGMARVSICSSEGHRLTYLLAVRGECLNVAGPVTRQIRAIAAEAVLDTTIVQVERAYFNQLAQRHPELYTAIITVLANAVDSSNSRILDMVGKNVDQRLQRILHTLYIKFGAVLSFTSTEIAEMICTTTESTLRSLSKLRRKGIVETGRRKIKILKPDTLIQTDSETVWL